VPRCNQPASRFLAILFPFSCLSMAAWINGIEMVPGTRTDEPCHSLNSRHKSMLAIRISHDQGNASPAMNTTLSRRKSKPRCVSVNRFNSNHDSEVELNETEESE
jgi:hypothetical protein